jgi:DinB superfamily
LTPALAAARFTLYLAIVAAKYYLRQFGSGDCAAFAFNYPRIDWSTESRFPMQETVQQYVQRIQSKLAGQNPIKVQAATAQKLAKLMKRASPAKLRKRPAPDKWSPAEIIAHLADVEIVIGWRVRSILGAPGTPIQAFDQDAWVTTGHYAKRDTRKSLEQFRVLRDTNLALYKTLSPEQWKHHGLHSERGEETLEKIVRMMAGHDVNHLEQIERILAPKK